MADFGHGESPRGLQAHGIGQPLGMVLFGAKVKNGTGEEAPLDAGLDLQGWVRGNELLKGSDGASMVIVTTEFYREGALNCFFFH